MNVPTPDGPAGLLITRDLIFTTKVVGTARALGVEMMAAGNAALASAMLEQGKPKVVFIDLAAGDLVRPEALKGFRESVPGTPFVAFGSHVETELLDAARRAGCEVVMARSRFTAELPELVRRYLGAS